MDTFRPFYPRIEDEAASLQRETRLDPPNAPPPIRAEPPVPPGPSSPGRSTSVDGWDTQAEPKIPYSPTKTELDSHPIRQRLSIQGDEITTGLGSAPERILEFERSRGPIPDGELKRFGLKRERDWNSNVNMSDIKEGDAVSYQWNGDKKGGTVQEVATEGSVQMTTARGNTAEKQAKPDDPAVRMERAGHDVVKNVSELHKEEAGESHNEGGVQKEVKGNEAKTGEKRSAEPKENGEEPKKKKGRPAGKGAAGGAGGAAKGAQKKKRPAKRAATESGEPRRSGRVAKK